MQPLEQWQIDHREYLDTQPITFQIRTRNAFYDGWLMYILGMDQPLEEPAKDGWRMAEETTLYTATREVIKAECVRAFNVAVSYEKAK